MNQYEKILTLMSKLENNQMLNENNKKLISESDRRVLYTAIFLTKQSALELKNVFDTFTPEGWKWFGDHMTITMGEMTEGEKEKYLGSEVQLTVISFGISEKVMAVGVDGFLSRNKQPHITLAVNVNDGGKPKMSNDIINWKKYDGNLVLTGVVKEFSFK